jgi:hypothetical protein
MLHLSTTFLQLQLNPKCSNQINNCLKPKEKHRNHKIKEETLFQLLQEELQL